MSNWHTSIYPQVSERTLIQCDDFESEQMNKLCEEIETTKTTTSAWLFLARDVALLDLMLPMHWINGPTQKDPRGGFPPNVWIGTEIRTHTEAEEKFELLLRYRSKVLFVKLGWSALDLSPYLAPWRCENCGRRGRYERPKECPTGNLCLGAKLLSQIHWIISEEGSEHYRKQCEEFGVKFWGGDHQEIP